MKRHRFWYLLIVMGVLGLLGTLYSFGGVLWSFPLGFLGKVLRRLSLSGSLGNGLAVLLFVAICIFPVYLLYRQRKKRPFFAEDALLVLLSVLMLPLLYGAVNPGRFLHMWNFGRLDTVFPLGNAVVGSIVVGYAVFRMIRESQGSEESLIRLLRFLLYALAVFFILSITVGAASETIEGYRKILANAAGGRGANPVKWGHLLFGFLSAAMPGALGIGTVLFGLEWLDASAVDRYSEASLQAAARIAVWSKKALIISVGVHLAYQILQFVFLSQLAHVAFNVQIPIVSIFFVLAMLLFARRTEADYAMKQENDLFI